jgi:adenine-specific DNA-methyltransferase
MSAMEERETSRLELQERLDTAKTQAERNRLGQFATPPGLASEIIKYADSLLRQPSKIHFLEPGFGTGPFYSALLRHVPPSRIEAAAGYEIDSHYAEPAQSFWKSSGLRLHISSFTEAEPPKTEAAKYNLIALASRCLQYAHRSALFRRDVSCTKVYTFSVVGSFVFRSSSEP